MKRALVSTLLLSVDASSSSEAVPVRQRLRGGLHEDTTTMNPTSTLSPTPADTTPLPTPSWDDDPPDAADDDDLYGADGIIDDDDDYDDDYSYDDYAVYLKVTPNANDGSLYDDKYDDDLDELLAAGSIVDSIPSSPSVASPSLENVPLAAASPGASIDVDISDQGAVYYTPNPNQGCDSSTRLFQLELKTDSNACETSWLLEKLPEDRSIRWSNGDSHEDVIVVDDFSAHYYDEDTAGSQTLCLPQGKYRFTIYDAFGDGIEAPGYYMMALDGIVLAGSSDFGYEEATVFNVAPSEEDYLSEEETSTGEAAEELAVKDELADNFSAEGFEAATASSSSSEDEAVEEAEEEVESAIPDRLSGILDVVESTEETPSEEPADDIASAQDLAEEVDAAKDEASDDGGNTLDAILDYIMPSRPEDLTRPVVQEEPAQDVDESPQEWMTLIDEDFTEDLGSFYAGSSEYVTYYPYVKDRRGVVRIQDEHGNSDLSSSFYSNSVPIDTLSFSEMKVEFSYYANSMEPSDGFCLDYSTDDGTTWHSKKCWHAIQDFENDKWYDDEAVTFNLLSDPRIYKGDVDSLRIRIRCKTNSLNDDVLVDRIKLSGLVNESHVKDSLLR